MFKECHRFLKCMCYLILRALEKCPQEGPIEILSASLENVASCHMENESQPYNRSLCQHLDNLTSR